ncbi:MAG: hypothetical protein K2P13_03050, partial [Lachnospiraceae bacterium]|nr:hypothetical protein [Lachnospiraceae bacterium]
FNFTATPHIYTTSIGGSGRCFLETGEIRLPAGKHTAKLTAQKIVMKQLMGLRVRGILLERKQREEQDDKRIG